MNRGLAIALTATAMVWAALIVAAPVALHSDAAAQPASLLYLVSSRICHQRPERSFALAGIQMPVCARCSALYLAAALGTLAAWLLPRRTASESRTILAIAAVPTAVTFALEFSGVMRFSNIARALAALPLGAIAGWLFVRMLADAPLRYDSRLDAPKSTSN